MWPINKINKAIKRKKWRRLNSHNFTNPQNDFNFDLVSVGKGTYGGIYVLTFDDKHKLKIGNYCSIAPDVAFIYWEVYGFGQMPNQKKCICLLVGRL